MSLAPQPLGPRRWADLSSPEFARLDPARTVAVLPLGATEQHGPHLPLSVDSDILAGVIAAAGPRLPADAPVLWLPPQAVGRSVEHTAFPGTLTLGIETLIRSWIDIGECVARTGVRKLVLLNAHGGNISSMDIAGRELRARFGLQVWLVHTFQLALPPDVHALFTADEHRYGAHAGAVETSLMLALRPDAVRTEALARFDSATQARAAAHPLLAKHGVKLAWAAEDLNPAGAVGDTTAASAGKGHALLAAMGTALAEVLGELVRT